jgi:hypothetical protein
MGRTAQRVPAKITTFRAKPQETQVLTTGLNQFTKLW